ncbi:MAG: hypothetical protein GF418_10310 [Chitinivibrionales bacterium]|nr:hypothetical protein [Chitinivibrionales bacterium]MBD3396006.1 hypothetical protein [Chitinivibrionales bacterium]
MAQPGDTVMIAPGRYGPFNGMAKGTKTRPIVYRAEKKWGAVIDLGTSGLSKRAAVLAESEIGTVAAVHAKANTVLQGLSFENGGPGWGGGIAPDEPGVTATDCRFRNIGLGVGLNKEHQDCDTCHLIRCVFEDMYTGAVWSHAITGPQNPCNTNAGATATECEQTARWNLDMRVQDHRMIDCIIRRANISNISPCMAMGALKYLFTKDMVIDGLVSYDNNGTGFWMDWDSWNFVIKNCTFFGNHAGAHPQDGNCWWAGVGCWSEGNDFGAWLNNVSYGNGAGGFGILETGFANIDDYDYNDHPDGGQVRFEGNVIVDNPRGIEFRFCLRTPSNHSGGPVIMKNNVFKGWTTKAWDFGDPFTQNDVTVADAGWVIEGNIYDNSKNADILAEWTHSPCTVEGGYGYGGAKHCDISIQNRTACATIEQMRDLLDIEHEGSTESY